MQEISGLCTRLATYLEPTHINQVRRAYYYAEQAHADQKRRSGEPYVTHPLAVAHILADMRMDHQSLMAAMLHDVIEDTGISKTALGEQFGETVADLVDGVSKLTRIEGSSKAEAQAENFQKMAMAMARDIRVILVKLADRLHNMRTLDVLSPPKRRRIAHETLDIYAPIANRLGMNALRMELQDLGFNAMYPMRAQLISAAVIGARGHRKEVVEKIQHNIERCLQQEGHDAEVIGREKHLYSIYSKMKAKKKSFHEIMDVYAFRIIVDSVDTCYRVLGAIHNLYKPVHGEFRDYIAIPKANGYQSLHTVLVGMHGLPIEVQIRTREMDAMANSGVAAHWLYKTDKKSDTTGSQVRAREWIKGLLELQQSAGNPMEFIEHVKVDLFPDEVYVFTPTGEIIELPNGATAVDFAYAVHTGVGNTCVAARINRRLAPLSEPLQSGQTIAIVTAPGAQPNPAWLNFVKTGKARSAIRHFLKTQRHSDSIELGRKLLNKALLGMNSSLEAITGQQITELVQNSDDKNFDDILEDIGMGNRLAYVVARRLLNGVGSGEHTLAENSQTPLMIDTVDGLMISFAKCCHPIPGDAIVGHLSPGKGLVVHTEGCKNVLDIRANPEKCLPVNWSPNFAGEFLVDLRVEVENNRGIIATLAAKITEQEANIDKIVIEEKDTGYNIIYLTIAVKNRVHLANVMRRVRAITSVLKTVRVKN
ncbi:MAG: bifunctional GTP diphosphokinase/guanosine-3',5'-bis pyrophosphate 3'-pyrophosphohydrolase [Pseudomonadales bacterium]|nr:bifunctional GTP diphosphokinase/guanosine-3',5'-bis pyrophosphate 3'-pyrophosphohydrolase [Pseudomonadales bacterium]